LTGFDNEACGKKLKGVKSTGKNWEPANRKIFTKKNTDPKFSDISD
jgi:hypothetical protein